ncbi:MAG: sensor histidine kinase [Acidimicrobiales bacterium]
MEAARAWFRRHAFAVDALVAVAFFALGILSVRIFYDLGNDQLSNFRFATGVACMALLTLPLAVRRRFPPITLAGVVAAVLVSTAFEIPIDPLILTVAFLAIYSVGTYCSPRTANWVRGVSIAIAFGALVWILVFREIDVGGSDAPRLGLGLLTIGSNLFFFIAAWIIGDVARTSRLRAAELEVRNVELQTARDVIAEQAILDERVRIARELHDVVAHHVSVMGVQAGAARRVMAQSPEQAAEVLSGIESSSRQAVAELQRLLGFLRSESTAAPPGSLTAPQPGLSQLGALVAQMNEAGLLVSLETTGTPEPLSAGVELSAFRVIQEALTNALKHGGVGTMVTVTLTYWLDHLELSVVDDGRGRSNGRLDQVLAEPALARGHGLVGMRERVALTGGRFQAARRRGSGFEVTATIPLFESHMSAP